MSLLVLSVFETQQSWRTWWTLDLSLSMTQNVTDFKPYRAPSLCWYWLMPAFITTAKFASMKGQQAIWCWYHNCKSRSPGTFQEHQIRVDLVVYFSLTKIWIFTKVHNEGCWKDCCLSFDLFPTGCCCWSQDQGCWGCQGWGWLEGAPAWESLMSFHIPCQGFHIPCQS